MKNIPYIDIEMSRRLRSLLVSKGLTLREMSKKMGMSRPTLSTKINGKTDFTRTEMELFATILGKKPRDIFF